MALGYAAHRPSLHPLIMEKVRRHLPWRGTVARALDIGCGAGLSTAAIGDIAAHRIGIDVSQPMVRVAAATAPGSDFLAGRAEAIPLAGRSVDLITAAGSLNYAALPLFFREAERVLVPGGIVAIYDFSPGRAVDGWLAAFIARYPWPPTEALELNPRRLAAVDPAFRVHAHENFEIGITLTREFYLEYMMTETNVAHAVRSGIPEAAIRSWCSSTLEAAWSDGPKEVVFPGYLACLAAARI